MSKEQLKIAEAYKLWKWLTRKSERVQIELINVPYNIRFGINEEVSIANEFIRLEDNNKPYDGYVKSLNCYTFSIEFFPNPSQKVWIDKVEHNILNKIKLGESVMENTKSNTVWTTEEKNKNEVQFLFLDIGIKKINGTNDNLISLYLCKREESVEVRNSLVELSAFEKSILRIHALGNPKLVIGANAEQIDKWKFITIYCNKGLSELFAESNILNSDTAIKPAKPFDFFVHDSKYHSGKAALIIPHGFDLSDISESYRFGIINSPYVLSKLKDSDYFKVLKLHDNIGTYFNMETKIANVFNKAEVLYISRKSINDIRLRFNLSSSEFMDKVLSYDKNKLSSEELNEILHKTLIKSSMENTRITNKDIESYMVHFVANFAAASLPIENENGIAISLEKIEDPIKEAMKSRDIRIVEIIKFKENIIEHYFNKEYVKNCELPDIEHLKNCRFYMSEGLSVLLANEKNISLWTRKVNKNIIPMDIEINYNKEESISLIYFNSSLKKLCYTTSQSEIQEYANSKTLNAFEVLKESKNVSEYLNIERDLLASKDLFITHDVVIKIMENFDLRYSEFKNKIFEFNIEELITGFAFKEDGSLLQKCF